MLLRAPNHSPGGCCCCHCCCPRCRPQSGQEICRDLVMIAGTLQSSCQASQAQQVAALRLRRPGRALTQSLAPDINLAVSYHGRDLLMLGCICCGRPGCRIHGDAVHELRLSLSLTPRYSGPWVLLTGRRDTDILYIYRCLSIYSYFRFILCTCCIIYIYIYIDIYYYYYYYYTTLHYTTIHYNTIQYNTIQYNTIQYNTSLKENSKPPNPE